MVSSWQFDDANVLVLGHSKLSSLKLKGFSVIWLHPRSEHVRGRLAQGDDSGCTVRKANVKLNQKITPIVSGSNLNCILLKNVEN